MYLCVCHQIRDGDVRDLTKDQLKDFLEDLEYIESCKGCLEHLIKNTKESGE